ncbi:MAG TPA: molybdenum ABC transporter ATP-binding protein [Terriglobales bacterium]|nr:molybdenum ABC transporter ATP-binding protein [Terriglobales bacterium]
MEVVRSQTVPVRNEATRLEAQISKKFASEKQSFNLEVNFTAEPGITILFGASGAGKTTLLDCIAGLTTPDSGRIAVSGKKLFDSSHRTNVATESRNVGYVLQDLALFPHLTAEQNVRYGLSKLSTTQQQELSSAIMESFRIAHLAKRKPREISGGERQRVALARTLVTDPVALMLDEPLAALDIPTKSKIIDDLRAWNEAHRVPILYVTHSRDEVFALGERVLILEKGQIIADGAAHQVMAAPRMETVASLTGFENIFGAVVTAVHGDRGTMTCKLKDSEVELETPLVKAAPGTALRVGIQAGDVLLAISQPAGLSARNIVEGKITMLMQRDVIVVAKVNCGVEMEVHLTLAARYALHLQPGQPVWLIVKTHSCHLMRS